MLKNFKSLFEPIDPVNVRSQGSDYHGDYFVENTGSFVSPKEARLIETPCHFV
jgi:hypothetical protein